MTALENNEKLIEEINLYLHYAVPVKDEEDARKFVARYRHNKTVLNVLRQYYLALPDAEEAAAIRVSKLLQRQGVTLFVVSTPTTAHLYAVSADNAAWLGEYLKEIDEEILGFWGFPNQQAFLRICPPIDELTEYKVGISDSSQECPACGVAVGEYHLLGCSVEVCPWCEGQLNKCNCRFEQLEVDAIDSEDQVERFLELLEAKGRVVYQEEQAPYYPGTSMGLDMKK
jgi:hypothetical protein